MDDLAAATAAIDSIASLPVFQEGERRALAARETKESTHAMLWGESEWLQHTKPDRYISKHPGSKPPTFSTFGLSGTSKPGYKNVQGAEAATAEGHHAYQKSHATFGTLGNAKKTSEILKKGTGGGGGAADLALASSTGYAFKYTDRRMPQLPTRSLADHCAS